MRSRLTYILTGLSLGIAFAAQSAEVKKVGSDHKLIAVSNQLDGPWKLEDILCVYHDHKRIACGKVAKVGTSGAVVRLFSPKGKAVTVATGDAVRLYTRPRAVASLPDPAAAAPAPVVPYSTPFDAPWNDYFRVGGLFAFQDGASSAFGGGAAWIPTFTLSTAWAIRLNAGINFAAVSGLGTSYFIGDYQLIVAKNFGNGSLELGLGGETWLGSSAGLGNVSGALFSLNFVQSLGHSYLFRGLYVGYHAFVLSSGIIQQIRAGLEITL
jgi:hypothetical protein